MSPRSKRSIWRQRRTTAQLLKRRADGHGRIAQFAEFLHGQGLGPATEIDPGAFESHFHGCRREAELFQSVPERLAPLGEGGLHDPYEEVMVAEGNCRSIAHR